MYDTLLRDEKTIIKQKTLESLVNFLDVIGSENPSRYIENLKELHEAAVMYFKHMEGGLVLDDSYLTRIKSLRYKHRCLEWSSIVVPQQKKFKSNANEVEMHLQKIQEHLGYLKCICDEQRLNQIHLDDVNQIISQMQALL